MRVFVAGATGVIGRRVVGQLVASGHGVTAVARRRPSLLAEMGASPVDVDLFDHDAVTMAVAGHDAVVNLATHIPTGRGMMFRRAWRDNDRLRTIASRLLADAAAECRAQAFVQESVTLLYAGGGDAWLHEGASIVPTALTRSAVEAEGHAARSVGRGVARGRAGGGRPGGHRRRPRHRGCAGRNCADHP